MVFLLAICVFGFTSAVVPDQDIRKLFESHIIFNPWSENELIPGKSQPHIDEPCDPESNLTTIDAHGDIHVLKALHHQEHGDPSDLYSRTLMDNFQARVFKYGNSNDLTVQLTILEKAEDELNKLIQDAALRSEVEGLVTFSRNLPKQCPFNVVSVPFKDRCLSFQTQHTNYYDAKKFCDVRGGKLATQITENEWNILEDAYSGVRIGDIWLGSNENENTFFHRNSRLSSAFRLGRQTCPIVRFHPSVHYIQLSCSTNNHFLCEYPLRSIGSIFRDSFYKNSIH